MTNEEILRIALLQSSYDCNCSPEDFLSIGGTYTTKAKEAAGLANAIQPAVAVPMHYGSIVGKPQDAEVMLDATLEDEEALKGYAVHPAHVAAADTYVRPYAVERVCMDYEII